MLEYTEFLGKYRETVEKIADKKDRLKELDYPERGLSIEGGTGSGGISNQPEQIVLEKEQIAADIEKLQRLADYHKRQLEKFLKLIRSRKAKILRRIYVDGFTRAQLAKWMHVQEKSAAEALREAEKEGENTYQYFYK